MGKGEIAAQMKSDIKDFLNKQGINRVILGLSGGADSVALLKLLLSAEIEVICIHCNFHLRGEESDRDMLFARQLCETNGVPLETVNFDTIAYCSENKLSLEMGCRELRYNYFRNKLKSTGFDRIAIAHHLDDNIETLFLNLMRGSGVSGLKGMLPDNGEIVRPLLKYSRKDIMEYLASTNQDFITDSSNSDNKYRRNFLRNRLIPLLEEVWPGAEKALANTLSFLQEDFRIIDAVIGKFLAESKDSVKWDAAVATGSPTTAIYRFIEKFGGNSSMAREITRHFINASDKPGKRWITPGFELIAGKNELFAIKKLPDVESVSNGSLPDCFTVTEIANSSESLSQFRQKGKPFCLITPYPPSNYIFRHPRGGDRIKPLGMKGSSKISDIMKDAALTPVEKLNTWIAEDKNSGEIIWVEGLKRSRHHLVSDTHDVFYLIKRSE